MDHSQPCGEGASLAVVPRLIVLPQEADGKPLGPNSRVLFLKRKGRACCKSANVRQVLHSLSLEKQMECRTKDELEQRGGANGGSNACAHLQNRQNPQPRASRASQYWQALPRRTEFFHASLAQLECSKTNTLQSVRGFSSQKGKVVTALRLKELCNFIVLL